MAIDWPSTLPDFVLQRGYKQSLPNTLLRTNMDTGPAKVRRKTSTQVMPLNTMLQLTSAELTILKDFFRTTLGDGALEFDWTDPSDLTAASMRFISPPSWTSEGADIFAVICELEIMP